MKRSLMKKYIADALYCHVPFSNEKELLVIAECVLGTIEGGNPTGDEMLPPFVDGIKDSDNYVNLIVDQARYSGHCAWEQE